MMIVNDEQVKICEVVVMAYFRVMSRNLPERTKEKHKTSQDRW
jgi:hypothetical protein